MKVPSTILAAVLATTSAAQDCPEVLIPLSPTREYDGYWTNTTGVFAYPTRSIVLNYQDNRMNMDYAFELRGEISLRNERDVASTLRYRISIPVLYAPNLPVIETQDICIDWEAGEFVWYGEVLLEAGQEAVFTLDSFVRFEDPNGGADLNNDYRVDAADLGILYANWMSDNPLTDLNGDGITDGGDVGFLLLYWSDDSQ